MVWTPQKTTLQNCLSALESEGNLAALPKNTTLSAAEIEITQLSYDSRKVQPGTLFLCKGAHFRLEYLLQAAEAGAVAYVSEQDYSSEFERLNKTVLPALCVHDMRTAIADLAALFYRGLLDNLTLIGFTGTKGKSTTTYMLRAILDSWLAAQGKAHSAWLSSIENYDGTARTRALLTTQETLELYEHFEHAVQNGIEYLTMEVSSQALKYSRTRKLQFEVAGFLNIGSDHISAVEHPNHEDYLASKLLIFEQAHKAVVNTATDELARVLQAAEVCESTVTFGREQEADFVASCVEATTTGLSFEVTSPCWQASFTLPMAGRFNVDNALAALATADALGVPVKHMQDGLASCEVNGRMQLMQGPDNKLIIIDYAHNKLSFETIFSTVAHEYPDRLLVAVFGATGSKGAERRLDLPAVAAQYAAMIYITEDDPGEEPLELINQQIAEVARAAGVAYAIVEDRDEAIRRAITEAVPDSIILVLGKGHETLMKRGRVTVVVPSDKERVERLLAAP